MVVIGLIYLAQDYSSGFDQWIMDAKFDQSGNDTLNKAVVSGMKADRQSMFGGQVYALYCLWYSLGIIYMYLKNTLKSTVAVVLLIAITFYRLMVSR